MSKRHAFTLIEMLVVIAIIGIVAALVINMNSGAQAAKRNAQVNADKSGLMLMINDYHSKLNFFPPDNTNLATLSVTSPVAFSNYDVVASTNPLLYELTGSVNNTTGLYAGTITTFDGTNVPMATFQLLYGRTAVANANTDEPHNFFQTGPQGKEYTNYDAVPLLKGLIVPVILSTTPNQDGTQPANFWHYDASSTNRHNLQGYDLWAEYVTGTKNGALIITTNGNW